MKLFLIIYLLLFCSVAFAQEKDSSVYELRITKDNPKKTVNSGQNIILKPEIFTSGFIDIINTGQVNASARFIRLFIGEPGKFSIPMSLYSGVSSNNLQNTTSTLDVASFKTGIYFVEVNQNGHSQTLKFSKQ